MKSSFKSAEVPNPFKIYGYCIYCLKKPVSPCTKTNTLTANVNSKFLKISIPTSLFSNIVSKSKKIKKDSTEIVRKYIDFMFENHPHFSPFDKSTIDDTLKQESAKKLHILNKVFRLST